MYTYAVHKHCMCRADENHWCLCLQMLFNSHHTVCPASVVTSSNIIT